MDFGRGTANLNEIDFSLPDNPLVKLPLLNAQSDNIKILLGTGKSAHKDWIGPLYPAAHKPKNNLKEYSKHFGFIELNASFFNTFSKETIDKWIEDLPKDFLFCPKFNRSISHLKRLNHAERETEKFLDMCNHFGNHLGRSLLQLPDKFSPKSFTYLTAYIESLPRDLKIAVELRSELWYADPVALKEIFMFFKERQITAVITDTNLRRDVLHMCLTAPDAYIRFNGNYGHQTDTIRLQNWAVQLEKWRLQGLQQAFFVIHQPDDHTFNYAVQQTKKILKGSDHLLQGA